MMENSLDMSYFLLLNILGGFTNFGLVHIGLWESGLDHYTFFHVLDYWRDVCSLIYFYAPYFMVGFP